MPQLLNSPLFAKRGQQLKFGSLAKDSTRRSRIVLFVHMMTCVLFLPTLLVSSYLNTLAQLTPCLFCLRVKSLPT